MDLGDQILPQSRMDGAVARNPRHTRKSIRSDTDLKMALAAFLKPRMATMAFAIIDHLQKPRGEGLTQACLDFLCSGHVFRTFPLHLAHQNIRVLVPSREGPAFND